MFEVLRSAGSVLGGEAKQPEAIYFRFVSWAAVIAAVSIGSDERPTQVMRDGFALLGLDRLSGWCATPPPILRIESSEAATLLVGVAFLLPAGVVLRAVASREVAYEEVVGRAMTFWCSPASATSWLLVLAAAQLGSPRTQVRLSISAFAAAAIVTAIACSLIGLALAKALRPDGRLGGLAFVAPAAGAVTIALALVPGDIVVRAFPKFLTTTSWRWREAEAEAARLRREAMPTTGAKVVQLKDG